MLRKPLFAASQLEAEEQQWHFWKSSLPWAGGIVHHLPVWNYFAVPLTSWFCNGYRSASMSVFYGQAVLPLWERNGRTHMQPASCQRRKSCLAEISPWFCFFSLGDLIIKVAIGLERSTHQVWCMEAMRAVMGMSSTTGDLTWASHWLGQPDPAGCGPGGLESALDPGVWAGYGVMDGHQVDTQSVRKAQCLWMYMNERWRFLQVSAVGATCGKRGWFSAGTTVQSLWGHGGSGHPRAPSSATASPSWCCWPGGLEGMNSIG